MQSPSSPTGPLACVFPVEIPTSVPNPYLNPSANRVLAFTYTPAESTPLVHCLIAVSSSVTIVSVWWDPCRLTCLIASAREGMTATERVSERCSVS